MTEPLDIKSISDRISSQIVAEMRRGLVSAPDENCIRCAVAGYLVGAYDQSTAQPRLFRDLVGQTLAKFAVASVGIGPVSGHTADDPTSSAQWNEGCDFAMTQLCAFLGVDPSAVSWDAATETVDGDVRAVIGNILRAKFGEDWSAQVQPLASPSSAEGRE